MTPKRIAAETAQRGTPPRRVRERTGNQAPSRFCTILERIIRETPGVQGAALVDYEGETVDYAGWFDPFELKVTAAHFQLVIAEIDPKKFGPIAQLRIRARKRSYLIRPIAARYSLVLVLHRHAAFSPSERLLAEAHAELCAEAGWALPPRKLPWSSVRVETSRSDKRRPARVWCKEGWQPTEIIGSIMGLRRGERGFRVRLPDGAEMMLVREPLGCWFADEGKLSER